MSCSVCSAFLCIGTCFEDGDYCDFKLKMDAKPMEYWPPVFTQGKGYK